MSSPASTRAPTSSSSTPAASSTARKAESLDAIGEALDENGKVIVTGCMGAEPEKHHRAAIPNVLAVTGPQQYESVLDAVHRAVPPQHDPFLDLVPPRGHQAHAAALRLSEDFRRLQQSLHLLHHPEAARRPGVAPGGRRAARGRAAGRSRREGAAGHLARTPRPTASTSNTPPASGSDREVRAKFLDLAARARRARRLGAAALRLSLSACRRGHPADGGAAGAALSRHSVPACEPGRAQAHEAPGRAGEDARPDRALARDLPGPDAALDLHRRLSRRDRARLRACCSTGSTKPRSTASAASNTSRCAAPRPTISPTRCRTR